MLKIGLIATSHVENERRVPIHPEHLGFIPKDIRSSLVFEAGYGLRFGYTDEFFAGMSCDVAIRESILKDCDIVALPKPTPVDIGQMSCGQILWGWAHLVQQRRTTQAAIERGITVITWEGMNHWNDLGQKVMHIFYRNNEIAGYAAVLHVLELLGVDGHYGPRRKVVVISFGSVSKGAIYALQGRGYNNIHVFTKRPTYLVIDKNPDVYHHSFRVGAQGDAHAYSFEFTERPFIDVLRDADIIVNGTLQDTDNPVLFVKPEEVPLLKPRSVIVDVSCDEGMGFPFARPTTFNSPVFEVGTGVTYYSVDHTPSYLWDAASREISRAVIPFLPTIVGGPLAWANDVTIRKAVEIDKGVVVNEKILSFRNRLK